MTSLLRSLGPPVGMVLEVSGGRRRLTIDSPAWREARFTHTHRTHASHKQYTPQTHARTPQTQGGYDLKQTATCVELCVRALLGERPPPLPFDSW
jgi:hypothetical protein